MIGIDIGIDINNDKIFRARWNINIREIVLPLAAEWS